MTRNLDPQTPAALRPLATVEDIAKHYGVSKKTVYHWIHQQVGPGRLTFKVGVYRRARWGDIDRYDEQQLAAQQREAA
jgi:transposase